jgi:hypothetical protein
LRLGYSPLPVMKYRVFTNTFRSYSTVSKKRLLVVILPAFLLFSCHEDTTPAWLQIDAINLTTDVTTQGEASHGIVDAWVYMDSKPLGVFELPCKIPILDEGSHSFVIYAGIKTNGISATRTRYPFYERFDTTLTLVKNETISVNPTVTYKSNASFELKEDFESTGIAFQPDIVSDTPIVFIDKMTYPDIVQWGYRCGGIFLTEADSLFKAATHTYLDLPKGEQVFLEIDYMNSNTIGMGVIAQNSADFVEHTPLVIMNAQSASSMTWKKIYIELTEDVSFETNATSYEIYLLSVLDPENTSAVIYLDNIKIVRYQ